MQTAPGCALIAVITPHFVSPRHADLGALAVTFLTATRLPMLEMVAVAVGFAGLACSGEFSFRTALGPGRWVLFQYPDLPALFAGGAAEVPHPERRHHR